uniref:Apolipoprotein L6 n=1 Tax=Sus scrofa TaxID=9823 RepID=A0A8D1ZJ40_PIG
MLVGFISTEPQWELPRRKILISLIYRDKDNIPLHEDMKQPESDLSVEERIFLEEFPIMKEGLEEDLRRLRALAAHIDTTHKIVTKTSAVANAFAVLSGAVSILGSALAPATAGGSLVLSVTGRVLGTRGEATSILAKILECFYNQEAQAQVGSLMPTCGQELWQAGPISVTAAKKVVQNCGRTIEMGICAFQMASAHPRLATIAKRLLTTGQVSAQRSRQVQRALEGVAQLMKANAPLLRMAMAGFYLSAELLSLLKDWEQLKEGAKTELAEELRVQARALERKLKELTQCFESLQQVRLWFRSWWHGGCPVALEVQTDHLGDSDTGPGQACWCLRLPRCSLRSTCWEEGLPGCTEEDTEPQGGSWTGIHPLNI